MVKSLGEHWSLGLTSGISQSTYSNYDMHLVAMPGIEFNIFPYSQSTRKMFSFIYSAGYIYNDYNSVTIYDKNYQHLWGQSLETICTIIQKWGYAYFGSEWRNYFYLNIAPYSLRKGIVRLINIKLRDFSILMNSSDFIKLFRG